MKRWLVYFILLLQCFFAASVSAQVSIPPKPTAAQGIYVQDYAHVLSPADEQKILRLGQELDNKTTAQIAVLTVDTLKGQPIEDFSLAVLRSWGIGSREKNNGALFVIAVKDRQSRIEVGYGLEGILPDGLTGRIQDEAMIPYFKKGKYAAGIVNGYALTASIVAQEHNVQLEGITPYEGGGKKQAAEQTADDEYPLWMQLLIAAGVIILLIIDNLFLGGIITQMLFFAFLRGRGGGGSGGSSGGDFGGGSGGGGGSSRNW